MEVFGCHRQCCEAGNRADHIADRIQVQRRLLKTATGRFLGAGRGAKGRESDGGKPVNEVRNVAVGGIFSIRSQGTLYPDVIESCPPPGSGQKHSHTIKSHHNVGGLPKDLQFTLIEPLKELFKVESPPF